MRARVAVALAVVFGTCMTSACADSDDASTTTTSEQTWGCVTALQRTGFTTGTPVSEARVVLTRLSEDPELSDGERGYYADLAEAVADLADSATVGASLDDVECPVG